MYNRYIGLLNIHILIKVLRRYLSKAFNYIGINIKYKV